MIVLILEEWLTGNKKIKSKQGIKSLEKEKNFRQSDKEFIKI